MSARKGQNVPRSYWLAYAIGLVVVVLLPLVGHWVRRGQPERCLWDGLSLEPLYQVLVFDAGERPSRFCCIDCAENWLRRTGLSPRRVLVTDEESGEAMDSEMAHFVRSRIATNPVTGNRKHVFRQRAAAERHARTAGGRMLTGAERPFSFTSTDTPQAR